VDRTGLSERWLRKAAEKRLIPYRKIGPKLIFDLAHIDAYLEQGLVEAASQAVVEERPAKQVIRVAADTPPRRRGPARTLT
jgi:hypothetical protein